MEDLIDIQTQTQTQTPEFVESSQESQESQAPWGRLCSCIPLLDSVDLFESSYSFGKTTDCSICVNSKFPFFTITSKKHFQITRDGNIIYLTDMSKNGTFVNGIKIEKTQKYILSTNDIISLAQPRNKVFIFNDKEHYSFLPKQLYKKYYLSHLLGKGTYGEVRIVYNKQTCEPFAVKKITKGRSNDMSSSINNIQKIQTEIKILASFSHPFIIKMQEVCETEKEVFIILDLMQGGELTNRILSVMPFCENEIKFIFYQIVVGISYLHTNGISHRDIKAQNILLSTEDRYPMVKVSDFGLSKILEDVSLMETTCGSINYVAPEVINNYVEKYTKKVDVWSLGVLLFYMFCKVLPFVGPSREDVARKILQGNIDWEDKTCKSMPIIAKDLVKKMLIVDPDKRHSIDDVLRHPWIDKDLSMQRRVQKFITPDDSADEIISSKRQRLNENLHYTF